MSLTGSELVDSLQNLKEKRKAGEVSEREFYLGLVKILGQLAASLTDEVQIADAEVKKQIPLLLVFLEEQAGKLQARQATY